MNRRHGMLSPDCRYRIPAAPEADANLLEERFNARCAMMYQLPNFGTLQNNSTEYPSTLLTFPCRKCPKIGVRPPRIP